MPLDCPVGHRAADCLIARRLHPYPAGALRRWLAGSGSQRPANAVPPACGHDDSAAGRSRRRNHAGMPRPRVAAQRTRDTAPGVAGAPGRRSGQLSSSSGVNTSTGVWELSISNSLVWSFFSGERGRRHGRLEVEVWRATIPVTDRDVIQATDCSRRVAGDARAAGRPAVEWRSRRRFPCRMIGSSAWAGLHRSCHPWLRD